MPAADAAGAVQGQLTPAASAGHDNEAVEWIGRGGGGETEGGAAVGPPVDHLVLHPPVTWAVSYQFICKTNQSPLLLVIIRVVSS